MMNTIPPQARVTREGVSQVRPSPSVSAMRPLQIAAQYYLALASHLSGDYRASEQACRTLMPVASRPADR